MSDIENYIKLKENIVNYIKTLHRHGKKNSLQVEFQPNGALANLTNNLSKKLNQVNDEQAKEILTNIIINLQNLNNNLKNKNGRINTSRAICNFAASIKNNKSTKANFFKVLIVAISNIFFMSNNNKIEEKRNILRETFKN